MSKRKKHPRGNPGRRGVSFSARVAVDEFERWMADAPGTFTDPAEANAAFSALVALTVRAGVDVLDPSQIERVVDVLLDLGADGDELLDLVHDYLHFRVETIPGEAWAHAHAVFEELAGGSDWPPPAVAAALEEEALLEPELRRAALAGLPIVARVRDLLDWVGSGRAVTDSGALRRGDIGHAAAWLGISARGVAKLPTTGEYRDGASVVDGEAHVQSMWELPALTAWWGALIAADLIQVTRSRVKQGAAAAGWLHDATPPLDAAAAVAGVFVGQVLTHGLGGDDPLWEASLVRLTLVEAIAALDPDDPAVSGQPLDELEELLRPRVARTLVRLADAGLVAAAADGRSRVPEALRGAFARGVMLALAFADDVLGDHDEGGDVVVHSPGTAAELLKEIAPLLAAEGIDLDDVDTSDLTAVDSALARATERRNLELFTPVGEQRAMALTVHRLAAEALSEGNVDLARVVIDGIRPEPVGTLPSVAHVIGVGVGALDDWCQDPASVKALATVRLPAWNPRATRAARDILESASRGSAFAELSALHVRHGGRHVLTGTVLAVAGAVIALAAKEKVDVRDVAGRLLADG